jgi:hypothetical protein
VVISKAIAPDTLKVTGSVAINPDTDMSGEPVR